MEGLLNIFAIGVVISGNKGQAVRGWYQAMIIISLL